MNTPAPQPETYYAVAAMQNGNGQQLIVKTPIDGKTGYPIMGAKPLYAAQAVAPLNMQTPQGVQTINHPFQFDIPDALSPADAFARIPLCAEKGLAVELQRLKTAALRQGHTLNELPQQGGKRR